MIPFWWNLSESDTKEIKHILTEKIKKKIMKTVT